MKIRFLTLLCLLSMPFWLSSQTFSGAGAAIPDNPTVTSVVTAAVASTPLTNTCADAPSPTIDVPGILGYNYQITNVTITNIQHTWASDLDIFLIAPDGTSIELSTDNGGNTGLDVATNMVFNFNAGDPCATTWTSSASTTQPGNGMSPENGGTCPAFAPQFNFTCSINSATISGMPVDGNWTLSIDDDAGGDTGSFGSWSITFAALAPPATDSNGTAIDVAECCVAPCSLVGQTVVNEGLEPGECNEIIFFSDPTLAGEGCEICPDPMGVLPGAVTTQTGNSNYSENLDANG
ncbi:MAG: proprotein convertase P-domain-containing protein, partial [Saprospiraceae bacterium]|nr:proprotein convertase P-domain-containing protein [Saprospiraceae bacterium]